MRLADAVAKAVADSGQVGLVTAKVTAVPAPKVTVDVVGTAMTLPRAASYTPTVGDVVLLLTSPTGWFVICKIAT